MNKEKIVICWFRRDLRLEDQAALFHALKSGYPVLPLFIFDDNILNKLSSKNDRRVSLIYRILEKMHIELRKTGSGIYLKKGNPVEVFRNLIKEFHIQAVYTTSDYEPYAISRDTEIEKLLLENQIIFYSLKDQVIFEKNDIQKSDNQPYTVFTPYAAKWKQKISASSINHFPSEEILNNCIKKDGTDFFSIESIGFQSVPIIYEEPLVNLPIIRQYDKTRDFPGIEGTSKLSLHLRFGTISIRKLVGIAMRHNETWLNELIWREFFMMILWHFPKVVNHAFKQKYEKIPMRFDESEFNKWCEGKTGFPIVDAGMRELNETGFMHNRVRMITANFLTKLMLHDWRLGEAYFSEKLMDYDLSANNGNWQWSAGCGCDAAPYFRIFNPDEQIRKFDPEKKYIQKWITELDSPDYLPMLDYKTCRERALFVYKNGLDS
jgi:deoxyribodipyrimidine photo-lyase